MTVNQDSGHDARRPAASSLDQFGHGIRVDGQTAAAWDGLARAFLAHSAQTPTLLAKMLAEHADFALAQAFKGLALLLLGRRELLDGARQADRAVRAIAHEAGLDAREEAYGDALAAWLDGHPARAAARLDDVLRAHPGDVLTAKLVHAIRFILGDAAGMRASLEDAREGVGRDNPCRGYFEGCYAFALEETRDYEDAERIGRAAIETTGDDAWGVHAVAHVMEMTDRAREGLAWIETRRDQWIGSNNFRYHVWWHAALFHLGEGRADRALDLYDRSVRAEHTDDYRDIANAASLLMRLELSGACVGARWAELADLSAKRVDDGAVVFADLHYQMALAGAGSRDDCRRLVKAMGARSAAADGDMARVARDAGVAMAEALAAFRDERWSAALDWYVGAMPKLIDVGGSRAQRDVFHQIGVEAAIRSGRLGCARDLLTRRALDRGADDAFRRARLALVDRLEIEREAAEAAEIEALTA